MGQNGTKIWNVLVPLAADTVIRMITAILLDALFFQKTLRTAAAVWINGTGDSMPDGLALKTVAGALVAGPVFIFMWKRDEKNRQECHQTDDDTMTCCLKKDRNDDQGTTAGGRQNDTCLQYMLKGIAAFLSGMAVSWILGMLMRCIGITDMCSNEIQEELLKAGTLLMLAGYCLIVPVAEEYLFRGLVYGRLCELMPEMAAAVTASLLFALSHGNLIQALYAFPMALLLQWFYKRSGSLHTAILFHAGANFLTVLLTVLP